MRECPSLPQVHMTPPRTKLAVAAYRSLGRSPNLQVVPT